MGGLLSAISGQFAKAIILGTLFPVVVVLGLNLFLVAPLSPLTAPLPGHLLTIATAEDKWGTAAVATFIVLLVTGLLYNLNNPIIRLYEGYPWANSLLGKYFAKRETKRFKETTALLQAAVWLGPELVTAAPGAPLGAEIPQEATNLAVFLNSGLPDSEDFILPTRLGNMVRCFERYPSLAYGMDAIVLWPRLIGKIDSAFASTIDEAKTSFDFMLNTSFLSALTALAILMAGLSKPVALTWVEAGPWIWRFLVFAAMARVFYLLSISRASEWGGQVRSAFDLYRFDLLGKMGFVRKPLTNAEERMLWGKITTQLLYPTNWDPQMAYEEPSPRLVPDPVDIAVTALRNYGPLEPNQRVVVSIDLTNPDKRREVGSLVVVEPVPDGYRYVPGSATVTACLRPDPAGGTIRLPTGGIALNLSRVTPLELYVGPMPEDSTVTIEYAIKSA